MLVRRIVTAIISVLVLFLVLLEGNLLFLVALLGLVLMANKEYISMNEKKEGSRLSRLIYIFSGLMIIITFIGAEVFGLNLLYFSLFFSFLGLAIIALLKHSQDLFYRIKTDLFGLLYITFLLSHIILFRLPTFEDARPFLIIWFILVVTWFVDIGAFFVGTYLGKIKLAIKISPNKTLEGAIGGIIFGTLAAYFFARWTELPYGVFLPLGLLLSINGQLGDLFESCLKRNLICKDSGSFFPGHGGVLDRLDSLLFNIPFAYYYLSVCLLMGSKL